LTTAKTGHCPLASGLRRATRESQKAPPKLLLPGALLVPIGAQFLAPFMFVDLAFAAFL
jgi:hypothetical protein